MNHRQKVAVCTLLVGVIATVVWVRRVLVGTDEYMRRIERNTVLGAPDLKVIRQQVRAMLLKDPELSKRDVQLATLGRKLFFDAGLSRNGHVSCAQCHNPELSFTDGKTVSHGIGPTDRNAPTVVNTFSNFWFFWDGRADSLAAQALGPLEQANEHGLTRSEVVRHVWNKHRDDYEKLFGPLPDLFLAALPEKAKPLDPVIKVSQQVAKTAAASLTDPAMMRRFVEGEKSRRGSGTDFGPEFFQPEALPFSDEDLAASNAYDSLKPLLKGTLDRAFANIGLAIEAYEKGLVANESAFDLFASSWARGQHESAEPFFSDGFGNKELLGLQIFLGKGACNTCHTGANLTDNQFHNIGLPQRGDVVGLGRSLGMLKVLQDPFNCRNGFAEMADKQLAESCRDLPFLNTESPEGLGALKTPSLRNVALTAPYMHDGRMASLRQVLEHYNAMNTLSAVGFREETLKPLNLDQQELEALEAFLRSLTSPVRDLSATLLPSH